MSFTTVASDGVVLLLWDLVLSFISIFFFNKTTTSCRTYY